MADGRIVIPSGLSMSGTSSVSACSATSANSSFSDIDQTIIQLYGLYHDFINLYENIISDPDRRDKYISDSNSGTHNREVNRMKTIESDYTRIVKGLRENMNCINQDQVMNTTLGHEFNNRRYSNVFRTLEVIYPSDMSVKKNELEGIEGGRWGSEKARTESLGPIKKLLRQADRAVTLGDNVVAEESLRQIEIKAEIYAGKIKKIGMLNNYRARALLLGIRLAYKKKDYARLQGLFEKATRKVYTDSEFSDMRNSRLINRAFVNLYLELRMDGRKVKFPSEVLSNPPDSAKDILKLNSVETLIYQVISKDNLSTAELKMILSKIMTEVGDFGLQALVLTPDKEKTVDTEKDTKGSGEGLFAKGVNIYFQNMVAWFLFNNVRAFSGSEPLFARKLQEVVARIRSMPMPRGQKAKKLGHSRNIGMIGVLDINTDKREANAGIWLSKLLAKVRVRSPGASAKKIKSSKPYKLYKDVVAYAIGLNYTNLDKVMQGLFGEDYNDNKTVKFVDELDSLPKLRAYLNECEPSLSQSAKNTIIRQWRAGNLGGSYLQLLGVDIETLMNTVIRGTIDYYARLDGGEEKFQIWLKIINNQDLTDEEKVLFNKMVPVKNNPDILAKLEQIIDDLDANRGIAAFSLLLNLRVSFDPDNHEIDLEKIDDPDVVWYRYQRIKNHDPDELDISKKYTKEKKALLERVIELTDLTDFGFADKALWVESSKELASIYAEEGEYDEIVAIYQQMATNAPAQFALYFQEIGLGDDFFKQQVRSDRFKREELLVHEGFSPLPGSSLNVAMQLAEQKTHMDKLESSNHRGAAIAAIETVSEDPDIVSRVNHMRSILKHFDALPEYSDIMSEETKAVFEAFDDQEIGIDTPRVIIPRSLISDWANLITVLAVQPSNFEANYRQHISGNRNVVINWGEEVPLTAYSTEVGNVKNEIGVAEHINKAIDEVANDGELDTLEQELRENGDFDIDIVNQHLRRHMISEYDYLWDERPDWQSAARTGISKSGDCEDLAVRHYALLMNLLDELGMSEEKQNFMLIIDDKPGPQRTTTGHVYLVYKKGRKYINLDTAFNESEEGDVDKFIRKNSKISRSDLNGWLAVITMNHQEEVISHLTTHTKAEFLRNRVLDKDYLTSEEAIITNNSSKIFPSNTSSVRFGSLSGDISHLNGSPLENGNNVTIDFKEKLPPTKGEQTWNLQGDATVIKSYNDETGKGATASFLDAKGVYSYSTLTIEEIINYDLSGSFSNTLGTNWTTIREEMTRNYKGSGRGSITERGNQESLFTFDASVYHYFNSSQIPNSDLIEKTIKNVDFYTKLDKKGSIKIFYNSADSTNAILGIRDVMEIFTENQSVKKNEDESSQGYYKKQEDVISSYSINGTLANGSQISRHLNPDSGYTITTEIRGNLKNADGSSMMVTAADGNGNTVQAPASQITYIDPETGDVVTLADKLTTITQDHPALFHSTATGTTDTGYKYETISVVMSFPSPTVIRDVSEDRIPQKAENSVVSTSFSRDENVSTKTFNLTIQPGGYYNISSGNSIYNDFSSRGLVRENRASAVSAHNLGEGRTVIFAANFKSTYLQDEIREGNITATADKIKIKFNGKEHTYDNPFGINITSEYVMKFIEDLSPEEKLELLVGARGGNNEKSFFAEGVWEFRVGDILLRSVAGYQSINRLRSVVASETDTVVSFKERTSIEKKYGSSKTDITGGRTEESIALTKLTEERQNAYVGTSAIWQEGRYKVKVDVRADSSGPYTSGSEISAEVTVEITDVLNGVVITRIKNVNNMLASDYVDFSNQVASVDWARNIKNALFEGDSLTYGVGAGVDLYAISDNSAQSFELNTAVKYDIEEWLKTYVALRLQDANETIDDITTTASNLKLDAGVLLKASFREAADFFGFDVDDTIEEVLAKSGLGEDAIVTVSTRYQRYLSSLRAQGIEIGEVNPYSKDWVNKLQFTLIMNVYMMLSQQEGVESPYGLRGISGVSYEDSFAMLGGVLSGEISLDVAWESGLPIPRFAVDYYREHGDGWEAHANVEGYGIVHSDTAMLFFGDAFVRKHGIKMPFMEKVPFLRDRVGENNWFVDAGTRIGIGYTNDSKTKTTAFGFSFIKGPYARWGSSVPGETYKEAHMGLEGFLSGNMFASLLFRFMGQEKTNPGHRSYQPDGSIVAKTSEDDWQVWVAQDNPDVDELINTANELASKDIDLFLQKADIEYFFNPDDNTTLETQVLNAVLQQINERLADFNSKVESAKNEATDSDKLEAVYLSLKEDSNFITDTVALSRRSIKELARRVSNGEDLQDVVNDFVQQELLDKYQREHSSDQEVLESYEVSNHIEGKISSDQGNPLSNLWIRLKRTLEIALGKAKVELLLNRKILDELMKDEDKLKGVIDHLEKIIDTAQYYPVTEHLVFDIRNLWGAELVNIPIIGSLFSMFGASDIEHKGRVVTFPAQLMDNVGEKLDFIDRPDYSRLETADLFAGNPYLEEDEAVSVQEVAVKLTKESGVTIDQDSIQKGLRIKVEDINRLTTARVRQLEQDYKERDQEIPNDIRKIAKEQVIDWLVNSRILIKPTGGSAPTLDLGLSVLQSIGANNINTTDDGQIMFDELAYNEFMVYLNEISERHVKGYKSALLKLKNNIYLLKQRYDVEVIFTEQSSLNLVQLRKLNNILVSIRRRKEYKDQRSLFWVRQIIINDSDDKIKGENEVLTVGKDHLSKIKSTDYLTAVNSLLPDYSRKFVRTITNYDGLLAAQNIVRRYAKKHVKVSFYPVADNQELDSAFTGGSDVDLNKYHKLTLEGFSQGKKHVLAIYLPRYDVDDFEDLDIKVVLKEADDQGSTSLSQYSYKDLPEDNDLFEALVMAMRDHTAESDPAEVLKGILHRMLDDSRLALDSLEVPL